MTSIISSEVSVAGEEAPPTEASSVATSPTSLFSTEVTVAETPAEAPPEERVETAPEGKPWAFIAILGLLGGLLLATRRRKREEERGR